MALQLTLLVPIVGVLCQLVTEAGSCPPENIPAFQDTSPRVPLDGPVQAIVPAYTFTCHGNITLWGACVQPGGDGINPHYDINFLVFRPSSGGVGCYDLIGSNFLNDAVPGVTGTNMSCCVALTDIPPEDQIQVQPGDVVGFYAAYYRNGALDDGGIQLDQDVTTVIVWSTEILTITDPDDCPYEIGAGGNLNSSSAAAPVITAQVVTITSLALVTSSTSPTPSSYSSPSITSSQSSKPQPPVPSSTNTPVSESTINEFISQNLIIYGAGVGVVGLVLIVANVCIIVISRKKRGVANISLQDNIQRRGNEAYSTHLTSFAIPTAQNEAYSAVQPVDNQLTYEEPSADTNEGSVINQPIYEEPLTVETNIPAIPTAQNEAYGAVQSADTNEGSVINQLVYEEPSAVEARRNNIPTTQNEAYGSGGEDNVYDYVT